MRRDGDGLAGSLERSRGRALIGVDGEAERVPVALPGQWNGDWIVVREESQGGGADAGGEGVLAMWCAEGEIVMAFGIG